ncbi:MAG: sodium/pantothenate symporter, partial [Duodenibacillus sp.]|nr:sodium/pantothenate symporter [Duodenibacillus sp.]
MSWARVFTSLGPVVTFLALMLAASWAARRAAARHPGFVSRYYIGGRSLGGFMLAMTTVATYLSVSTFVGGLGMAWQVGYGWLYMAMVQVVAVFLVLGVFGRKLALVSKRIEAVTVIDVLRARYESEALAALSSAVIVVFFVATMVAQFVGGAKIFEAVTGLPYEAGLTFFAAFVVLYTAVGGFMGVAVTDAICSIAMVAGLGILFYSLMQAGGGYVAVMERIAAEHPAMLEPLGGGAMPLTLYVSMWLLVGVCTLSLPQSVVRCIGCKDALSLRRAIVIGTFVIGLLTLLATWIGVLSRGVLTGELAEYGGVDSITPQMIVRTMSPLVASVTILGPVAATISTIDSLLLTSSSSIVKDLWLHRRQAAGLATSERATAAFSTGCTLALGFVVYLIALSPPSLIWKINMFAFGGLETAFFWVLVLGLFWTGANKAGAVCALAGGTAVYCIAMASGFKVLGLHQIALGMAASLAFFLAGNLAGRPSS